MTAVGDPNQSIYGWRGASATTLTRFPEEFADVGGRAARAAACRPAGATTDAILRGRQPRLRVAAAEVPGLPCRCCVRKPGAGPGRVQAARLAHGGRTRRRGRGLGPAALVAVAGRAPSASAAVLCRTRSSSSAVESALRGGRPAGRGGRPRRAAQHARGRRRRRAALQVVPDPARGDAPDAAADRAAVPAGGGRPRRPGRVGALPPAPRRAGTAATGTPARHGASARRLAGRRAGRAAAAGARPRQGPGGGPRRPDQHRRGPGRAAAAGVAHARGQRPVSRWPGSGCAGCARPCGGCAR